MHEGDWVGKEHWVGKVQYDQLYLPTYCTRQILEGENFGEIEHSKHWRIKFWRMPRINAWYTERLLIVDYKHLLRKSGMNVKCEIIPYSTAIPEEAPLQFLLHLLPLPSTVEFSSLLTHALAEEITEDGTLAPNAPFG